MYKMYCVFNLEAIKKMNGIRGKMASQAGHAFVNAYWDAEQNFPEDAKKYKTSEHVVKITLYVDNEDELSKLLDAYSGVCGTSLIKDVGFTIFKEPTITCLGIGPIHEDKIGEDLKQLKLFK